MLQESCTLSQPVLAALRLFLSEGSWAKANLIDHKEKGVSWDFPRHGCPNPPGDALEAFSPEQVLKASPGRVVCWLRSAQAGHLHSALSTPPSADFRSYTLPTLMLSTPFI